MSYNILADGLASQKAFPYVQDSTVFNFGYRSARVLNEIHQSGSDIICPQEFNQENLYRTEMEKMGYDIISYVHEVKNNNYPKNIEEAINNKNCTRTKRSNSVIQFTRSSNRKYIVHIS